MCGAAAGESIVPPFFVRWRSANSLPLMIDRAYCHETGVAQRHYGRTSTIFAAEEFVRNCVTLRRIKLGVQIVSSHIVSPQFRDTGCPFTLHVTNSPIVEERRV